MGIILDTPLGKVYETPRGFMAKPAGLRFSTPRYFNTKGGAVAFLNRASDLEKRLEA